LLCYSEFACFVTPDQLDDVAIKTSFFLCQSHAAARALCVTTAKADETDDDLLSRSILREQGTSVLLIFT